MPKYQQYCPVARALEVLADGWGARWAFDDPKPEELDAGLLVWKIHQRIDRDRLPDKRTVIEFDFKGRGGRRVWLVLEPREVSVCVTPPRFDADLIVRAELRFSTESGWVASTTPPPRGAAMSSSRDLRFLRASFHDGSRGVRWRSLYGAISS